MHNSCGHPKLTILRSRKLPPDLKNSVEFTAPDNRIRAAQASAELDADAFNSKGGGHLQVSISIWANPFSSFVKIGFNQLVFRSVVNFVSGSLFGVQYNMNTINPRDQTRSSSESSFLRLAINTAILQVYKSTMAKKILFDDKKVSGVLVNTGGLE